MNNKVKVCREVLRDVFQNFEGGENLSVEEVPAGKNWSPGCPEDVPLQCPQDVP